MTFFINFYKNFYKMSYVIPKYTAPDSILSLWKKCCRKLRGIMQYLFWLLFCLHFSCTARPHTQWWPQGIQRPPHPQSLAGSSAACSHQAQSPCNNDIHQLIDWQLLCLLGDVLMEMRLKGSELLTIYNIMSIIPKTKNQEGHGQHYSPSQYSLTINFH